MLDKRVTQVRSLLMHFTRISGVETLLVLLGKIDDRCSEAWTPNTTTLLTPDVLVASRATVGGGF